MNTSLVPLNNTGILTDSIPYSRTIIFYILIILGVPSTICSIFLFIQFILRTKLRRQPMNLFVFFLILVSFIQKMIEMPLTLSFLYRNRVLYQSYWFCQLWNVLQYSLSSTMIWITMIGSIERYLYVFHPAFLKRHFIILRLIPLLWSLFHPLIMQMFLIVIIPPCTSSFHFNSFMCGFPCYLSIKFWSIVEWNMYVGIPLSVIVISNAVLIGHVMKHKHRLKQSRIWSKVVKLIVQLISLALIDIIAWTPIYISVQGGKRTVKSPLLLSDMVVFTEYFVYLPYLVVNLCPFMCLIGLHEVHQSMKNIIHLCCLWKRIQVQRIILNIRQRRDHEIEDS